MLLQDKGFTEISQFAAKEWRVSDRQSSRYIAKAHEFLAGRATRKREAVLGEHIARREVLFEQAKAAEETQAALSVLKDLAELQNLYPAKNINTNSTVSFPDPDVMKAEILKRIQGKEQGDGQ